MSMKLQILTQYVCRIIKNMNKMEFSRIWNILKWNLSNINTVIVEIYKCELDT